MNDLDTLRNLREAALAVNPDIEGINGLDLRAYFLIEDWGAAVATYFDAAITALPTLVEELDSWRGMQRQAKAAREIEAIVYAVEARCMAVDGPVTPTLSEMSESELRQLWKAAHEMAKLPTAVR